MNVSSFWVSYAALGVFAGLAAGLLGIGGGLVIVPVPASAVISMVSGWY
ncbi:hypothetical protein DFR30_2847 [Thiogranum longum]|uniref:Sulfite exporter TauE/SafE n=1 Tax=Thiogranum longum TaxID=1537524 RepID=A0A4R1HC00_9GAMM|nr:hypothetical protein DFR30_2847 [Thiogranum longum]